VFHQQARTKGLGLEIAVGEDVPEWVMGDPLRLRPGAVEPGQHAVKFTARGGVSVRVSTSGTRESRACASPSPMPESASIAAFAPVFSSPFSQGDASMTKTIRRQRAWPRAVKAAW